ncbi:MAG: FAD-binding oxidoreductase [Alphaproteobacteria bacterium]|jgi:D-lactate dehydrogenase (cytochrome)|nr:FAD-binding oxidoreductase [Alphaproteobacteria bacterium]
MIEKFKELLSSNQVISGSSVEAQPFLVEKRGNFKSACSCIVLPKNTSEVSKVVSFCHQNNISIVPQAGNTGLVGGGVANDKQIILSAKLMNSIIEVDTENFSITVESGSILKDIQNIVSKHNRYFPLSLPSENTCCIGGNLATNAGGISVLKYGNTRDLTLGLEVVLPDGSIYSDLNKLRKRNIGSDLKHLFIGSEGTLGFITKACLKIFPKPKKILNVLITLNDIDEAEEYFQKIYNEYSSSLSSFELFNHNALSVVKKHHDLKFSFKNSSWYIIMAFDILEENHNITEFIAKINKPHNEYIITEDKSIWDYRYLIPTSQTSFGQSLKHDVATPLSKMASFIKKSLNDLESKYPKLLMPVIFGHMGDGNLHFNISPQDSAYNLMALKPEIKAIIVENVMAMDGSFSSEHGVGLVHKEEFKKFYFKNQYNNLRLIKQTLDSKNIFNPHKILDIN